MPFTVSHVAAVLPMMGRSRRLPTAALVIGSMTPDYPYFLTRGWSTGFSHSLLGIVTVDLAVGLAAVLLWRRWVQAPVRDLLPRSVGARLPRPVAPASPGLGWLSVAVVLGVVTHVVWDSFTHAGRWGVELVPWLQQGHGGVVGWEWAQEVSSVLGLLVVAMWGLARLGRTDPDPTGLSTSGAERVAAWAVVLVPGLLGAAAGAHRYRTGALGLEIYGATTFAGMAMAAGLAVVCAFWWLAPARRPAEVAPGIRN